MVEAILGVEAVLTSLWVVYAGEKHLLPLQSPDPVDTSAGKLAAIVVG
jgi:hypothetical protein